MNRVCRRQLAKLVSKRAEVSENVAHRVISEALLVIADELAKGKTVSLTGFGSWRTKVYRPRAGNSPQDGTPIAIPARTRVVFKTGSKLRETAESSIDAAIFFGDGVAPSTEIKMLLSKLFEPDLSKLEPQDAVRQLSSVIGPIGDKEGEEFFKMLYEDEDDADEDDTDEDDADEDDADADEADEDDPSEADRPEPSPAIKDC